MTKTTTMKTTATLKSIQEFCASIGLTFVKVPKRFRKTGEVSWYVEGAHNQGYLSEEDSAQCRRDWVALNNSLAQLNVWGKVSGKLGERTQADWEALILASVEGIDGIRRLNVSPTQIKARADKAAQLRADYQAKRAA